MAQRKREKRLQFRVTEEEWQDIRHNMSLLGTKNAEAYLRKMALNGYIVRLDFSEVREMVRVLRITSNSLNQLTKLAHETGSLYREDVEDLRRSYDKLWDLAEQLLLRMASL